MNIDRLHMQSEWEACLRGDAMIWHLAKQRPLPRRILALASCDCAILVEEYLSPKIVRTIMAIRTFAMGDAADFEMLLDDKYSAGAMLAKTCAHALSGTNPVYSATFAQCQTAPTVAARIAANAHRNVGKSIAAREQILAQSARIVRSYFPWPG